jgi:hypothetical protein
MLGLVGNIFDRIELDTHCINVATENMLVNALISQIKFQSSGSVRIKSTVKFCSNKTK